MAGPASTIDKIQFQLGRVKRVLDDFVKMNVAAVAVEGGFCGILYPKPRRILGAPVDICPGNQGEFAAGRWMVHHEGQLVPALAFVLTGFEKKVGMAVIDVEGRFYVILVEVNGEGTFAVDGVFQIAAALDFPTVVDAATGTEQERDRG